MDPFLGGCGMAFRLYTRKRQPVRVLLSLCLVSVFASSCLGQHLERDIALESVRRLVGLFKNSHVTASIAIDDMRILDSDYRERLRVSSWICDDAVLTCPHEWNQCLSPG